MAVKWDIDLMVKPPSVVGKCRDCGGNVYDGDQVVGDDDLHNFHTKAKESSE